MTWAEAKFWLDAAALVLALGSWGYTWLSNRSRQNDVRFEQHGAVLQQHGAELITIREQLKAQPTHGDLQMLHDRISAGNQSLAATREDVAALLEGLKGMRRAIDRLNDYHMGLKKE